ncbi:hypothetical protein ACFYW1_11080 [Streptomyces sp. NPDC002669]|uniref:hypothetical protein n=1 Tax=Streptomyces sp. NPDC002669 TaxID=3364658 RepID=UPI00367851F8
MREQERRQGQEAAGPGRGAPGHSGTVGDEHEGVTMGRPAETPDAPVTPAAGGGGDALPPTAGTLATGTEAPATGTSAPGAPVTGVPLPEAGASRAPEIAGAVAARRPGTARRGTADPVKSLMHRHRQLCERAVDPLEIAVGLEAHGITDRVAARYRHRDVFSLAEELFARMPGAVTEPAAGPGAPERDVPTRAAWSLRALLPGAACAATVGVLELTEGTLGGGARLAVALTGALLALAGLALALRDGPLSAGSRSPLTARLYGCWLLGYVLYGEPLLDQVLSGGPEGPWEITPAPLLGLALSLLPAAWCAHLFSVHTRRKLHGSRALEEFAAGVRPLLFGAVALHLCALIGLLHLARLGYGSGGAFTGTAALGVLLLLARLLTGHGHPGPATAALATACAVEALAPALILAGRLPGLHFLARPVDLLVVAGGTGAVPAVACGASALVLLITATVVLSRASAHTLARADESGTTG